MRDTDWRPNPCPDCGQMRNAAEHPVCTNPRCFNGLMQQRPALFANIEQAVTTVTTTRLKIVLDGNRLKKALGLPDSATVTFTVPNGGDYSGRTLDVDKDSPITVSWTEERQSDG